MDKCREEFEKQRYWIGLFREAVDFDGELGRYVLNGQRKLYAFHLDSFNDKWAVWQKAWQHQQAKVEELQQDLEAQREETIKGYTKISDLRLERDELQKRVDTALQVFEKSRNGCFDPHDLMEELEQALKGEV